MRASAGAEKEVNSVIGRELSIAYCADQVGCSIASVRVRVSVSVSDCVDCVVTHIYFVIITTIDSIKKNHILQLLAKKKSIFFYFNKTFVYKITFI